MSALSAHPDRSLSVCWEQHCKLLPGVAGISASTVAKWTIDEVRGGDPSLFLCLLFALTMPRREGSGKGPVRWKPHTAPDSSSLRPQPLPAAQWGLPEHHLIGPSWGVGRGTCRQSSRRDQLSPGLGSEWPHLGPPATQRIRILWGC